MLKTSELQKQERQIKMLKKIIALFIRPVPEKTYTPPEQQWRCYQLELPFER